jgi:hypothetical protein
MLGVGAEIVVCVRADGLELVDFVFAEPNGPEAVEANDSGKRYEERDGERS